jgi:uncharacterized protein
MVNNFFITKTMVLAVQWVRSLTAVRGALASARGLRQILVLLVAVSLLSASGCAWLDAKQRSIIYRPTPGVPADFTGLRQGDERYFVTLPQQASPPPVSHTSTSTSSNTFSSDTASVTTSPQQVEMWWLPHPDKNAPTLLYYHGTFRNLPQNLHKIDALRAAGFAILAVEYRGWGQSTAITPSEQSILQDADLAFTELQRREPRPAQRVLYGHSMGSGVAVDVASRHQAPAEYGALILESAITSFTDVAREAGFFASLLASFNTQRFASIEKITKVQAPVLMLHGTLDTTVPIVLGQKLFAAANAPKQWLAVEGGAHSNLNLVGSVQYQKALLEFKFRYFLGR